MATRLEQIIQPFVGQSSAPSKQGTLNLPQYTPYVILRVKASGGKVVQSSVKDDRTFYVIKQINEKTSSS